MLLACVYNNVDNDDDDDVKRVMWEQDTVQGDTNKLALCVLLQQ